MMKRQPFNKNVVIFCGLFLFALLLRLPGTSFHSLWFDETSTALCVSQDTYSGMMNAVNTFESTPPLFFLLEKTFLDVFRLSQNEFSLRFLPMLFGVLLCVLYFFLFRQVAGSKTAFGAYLLMTCSQYLIQTAHEARPYSLLCLLSLSTLFCTVVWWKKPDRRNTILLILSTAIAVQTHYYACLWLAVLAVSVFAVKKNSKQFRRYFLTMFLSGVTSFLLLLSLFMTQMRYQFSGEKDYLLAKWMAGIVYSPIKILLGSYLFKIQRLNDLTFFDMLGTAAAMLIIVTTILCCIRRLRRKEISDSEKIITFSMVFAFCLHVAIGWTAPTVHPRYMEYFLVLMFGWIVINTGYRKKLQLAVFIMIMALDIIANVRAYVSPIPYLIPWRNIAHAVDSCLEAKGMNAKPVIAPYAICLPVAFYLDKKETPLYSIFPLSNAAAQDTIAHLDLFGHRFFTSLYHYRYFPIAGKMSLGEIISSNREGIFVDKPDVPIGAYAQDLNRKHGKLIDFSIQKTFDSNQGLIAIIYWHYRG